ncbi:hypothetical protein N0V93_000157 [Gnomoniopsis smithogilvyi]|uniref:C2H2-type domain-containing protein n=1 Tax=Gnomoniopsis smithogilvyi TaxID=1191159 RepID=A0A9W8Z123_9PEZI|nr:hypothetical protein N0V93_000157 [Gnomoniopsis smithogilvyi]
MSSLQSIMNLDDDQQESSSLDKKNKDQATPASGFRRQDPSRSTSSTQVTSSHSPYSTTPSVPTITIPVTEGSQVYYPSQQLLDVDPSPSSSVQQGKRPAESSSATPTLSAASSGPGDRRRQSSTSVDSMDQYGYASSSSMGGGSGGGFPPNHPRRPMGTSPSPEVPVRYTPITGRVSRAKKGVPVHICESCNPPKTFTRAEHLRRHQLSHQQPRFPCDRCDRAFHRQDLLTRHQQRHNQEGGDQISQAGDDSRRGSGASGASAPMNEGSRQPYHAQSRGYERTSTTPSMSVMDLTPGTPPPGNQAMSPPSGAGDAYRPASGPDNYVLDIPPLAQPENSMEASPDPPAFRAVDDTMIPRTAPMPLYVSTRGLSISAALHTSLDNPPDLVPTTEYSPWTSASEFEGTYSTPHGRVSQRRSLRHISQDSLGWHTNPDFLTAFPNAARHEISTSGGLETMAATQYYVSNGFSVSPHMAPVPLNAYNSMLDGSMMPDYADDNSQTLLDPLIGGHHSLNHQRSSSVRSQTAEISIATSGQKADSLVTPAPLPLRIDPMAQGRQKNYVVGNEKQDGQIGALGNAVDSYWKGDSPDGSGFLTGVGPKPTCGIGAMTTLTPLPRSVRNAIPSYIDIYWERFHAFYPIIHRQAFEEHGEDVLSCAMAAIATQFSNYQEDRIRGAQLHDYAWQEAKRYAQMNLQTMQAILLCELFTRFRGRKAVVRPSKLFEHVYSRVLYQRSDLRDRALPSNAASFDHQIPMEIQLDKENQWRTWIEAEGRRRVLAACFIFDNHAAMFHESSRAKGNIDISTIPLTGHNDTLWSAHSADEWLKILHNDPAAGRVQFMPSLDSLTPEQVAQYNVFDRSVILNAVALSLPRRDSQRTSTSRDGGQEHISADDLRTPTISSYAARTLKGMKPDDRLCHLFSLVNATTPDIYVALHHTPLHDLLAVSGETWVFSQKVLRSLTFVEHQKRLKAWIEGRSSTSPTSPSSPTAASLEGMSSVKATIHAARALVGYFNRSVEASNGVTPYVTCISNYWGMYLCALIIWAFGQKAVKNSSSGSIVSPVSTKGHFMSEDDAVAWLRGVADSSMPDTVGRAKGRREASTVIVSMVKRRLEADCVGGRSRLYVDAVGVLKKLEEDVNCRWF